LRAEPVSLDIGRRRPVESVEQSRNFFFSDAAGIQNLYQRLCAMPPY
jgi:hypothetical protein